MSRPQQIEALLDEHSLALIYEGPMQSPPWQALVADIRQRFGVVACSLYLQLPGAGQQGLDVTDTDWDVQVLRDHNSQHYYRYNPFDYPAMQPGEVYRWTDFISRERFIESAYYREFCAPVGFDYALCLGIDEPGGLRIWLSVVRNTQQGDFSEAEANAFQRLYPHLQRALRLLSHIQRSETERLVYQASLEQMAIGTLVTDPSGHILSSNAAAQAIIDNCPSLHLRAGRLALRDAAGNRALKQSIASLASACEQAPPVVIAVERPGTCAMGLLLRRLPARPTVDSASRPALIIYLTDPNRHTLTQHRLIAQLFNLTTAEATLATLLAEGLSVADAARAMHISENSARTYCKRIYAKTGVNRQADIVRLVLGSVARLAG
ncbi:helix-turn-helix transcriptional regulator [Parahaliea mediterranea]|uniref:helix-turn-helix transcriptional regulator n=1 Tax=Parahaliea mediterranea TaxID=651086 RepID=UPI00130018E6|nr:helix-turn-helix transcriptional regulator [Parahaliea mediterranea]